MTHMTRRPGRTSICTPGGRPSEWHAPCSSTSSTRSGAPHLAFRWSSMRYFCFTLRVHKRLGLYWHSPHVMSPHPVDLQRDMYAAACSRGRRGARPSIHTSYCAPPWVCGGCGPHSPAERRSPECASRCNHGPQQGPPGVLPWLVGTFECRLIVASHSRFPCQCVHAKAKNATQGHRRNRVGLPAFKPSTPPDMRLHAMPSCIACRRACTATAWRPPSPPALRTGSHVG